MGDKLVEIYKIVEEKGGSASRVRLVEVTGITMKNAEEIKDKPDILDKVKESASDILKSDINELLKK
jgi:hypothetical protein